MECDRIAATGECGKLLFFFAIKTNESPLTYTANRLILDFKVTRKN